MTVNEFYNPSVKAKVSANEFYNPTVKAEVTANEFDNPTVKAKVTANEFYNPTVAAKVTQMQKIKIILFPKMPDRHTITTIAPDKGEAICPVLFSRTNKNTGTQNGHTNRMAPPYWATKSGTFHEYLKI